MRNQRPKAVVEWLDRESNGNLYRQKQKKKETEIGSNKFELLTLD